jgi:5-methylthioribose kinase
MTCAVFHSRLVEPVFDQAKVVIGAIILIANATYLSQQYLGLNSSKAEQGDAVDYFILNAQTVIDYVRSKPEAKNLIDSSATLEAEELSDGNLNFVFRVFEAGNPTKSILIKQGVPYLRVAGESWKLSPARAGFEARALDLQHQFAPGFVPVPYWFDEIMFVNAMEDLRFHEVMRKPMVNRIRFKNLGATIGEFLAKTLFGTSDFGMEASAKKVLMTQFANTELCEITEDLIFTEPFEAVLLEGKQNRNQFDPGIKPALEKLQADLELKALVAKLKYRFMTSSQALLHGDLHTGSIMASPPNEHHHANIRVIDPEFAFFGPIGFDVGLFVANLFLNASAQHGHAPDQNSRDAYRSYLLQQYRFCWEHFELGFKAQLEHSNSISWRSKQFQDELMQGILRDTAGFAGCEMIRRSVGFAHVFDVDSIANDLRRVKVLEMNLEIGMKLIKDHQHISSFATLENIVREAIEA